jgi:4'-phosphopantetheinyl transferase
MLKISLRPWTPSSSLSLIDSSIDLWWVDLDDRQHDHERYGAALSEDERARAAKFHFPHLQRRFRVRRALLRLLLAGYARGEPSALRYRFNRYGKPELETVSANKRLYFNLSHSGALVLYGFTYVGEIGVDIECAMPIDDMALVARQHFTPEEQNALWALPSEQQVTGFYNCWTRKEAILKAVGIGLTLPLEGFSVGLTPETPAQILWAGDARLHHVELFNIPIHAPYVAAAALYTP